MTTKEKYLGYEIKIEQDEYPFNPREDSNLWLLVTAHRNYSWDEELSQDCDNIEDAFEEHLKENGLTFDKVFYHRVWLYEHSWVTISTSPFWDRWDSWIWWYIYISIEDAEQNFTSINKDALEREALTYLDNEIKSLDKYYTWEIYWYDIDILDDNCWWFESEEEALQYAKEVIDSIDPKGKTLKYANDLYEESLDNFWDYVSDKSYTEIELDNWEVDEAKRDLIVNIIGNKLRHY